MDDEEELIEVPMEVIQLIKEKPEIAYKLMKTTLTYTLLDKIKDREVSPEAVDRVIYQYLDEHSVNHPTYGEFEIN